MEPVRRRSLIEEVTEILRTEIAGGTWAVGERIPTEVELCRRMGVGRNTIREAVQSLVHLGLLDRRQGSGTYVTASTELPRAVGRLLTAAQRREVVELRLALEVSAAELAARRRTEGDLERLRGSLAARARARESGGVEVATDADVALHRAVVAAAHNTVLLEVYDSVLPTLAAGVRTDLSHEAHYDGEHAEVVEAIVAGDSDRAAGAARRLLLAVLAAAD